MVSHFKWSFFWSSKGCYKASVVQSNIEAYSSTVQLKTWLTFKSPDSPPHKGMEHQRTCLCHQYGGPLSYRPARGSLHSLQTTLQFPDTAPVLTAASVQPSSPTAPPAGASPSPGKGGPARGEDGMDQACRPSMELAQHRLRRTVTASLTAISNPCDVWFGGGEAAENEVTFGNMPKLWM